MRGLFILLGGSYERCNSYCNGELVTNMAERTLLCRNGRD